MCKNKDCCRILMPSEKDKILEFNQYMKSDKMPYSIYAAIESLIKKLDGWSTFQQQKQHSTCEYSTSTIWEFDHIVNKHTLYHGKNCINYQEVRDHCHFTVQYRAQHIAFVTLMCPTKSL